MREFAEAFLLVFAQLAVGGLISLAVPPFQQIERGFYKSTAAVYVAATITALTGWGYLLLTREIEAATLPYRWTEMAFWAAFTAASSSYLYSLWGEAYRLRARSFLLALISGVAALTLTALRYSPAVGFLALLYPLEFLASALLLGAAATGMLLGHWYLIDLGLTLTPFRRIHRFFVRSIHFQVVILAVGCLLLWAFGGPVISASLSKLTSSHSVLLVLRLVLGPVAAYGLAWMIGRTLAIPQTMAATGLFYIAMLAVVVGEILGRTILFRTSMPL